MLTHRLLTFAHDCTKTKTGCTQNIDVGIVAISNSAHCTFAVDHRTILLYLLLLIKVTMVIIR